MLSHQKSDTLVLANAIGAGVAVLLMSRQKSGRIAASKAERLCNRVMSVICYAACQSEKLLALSMEKSQLVIISFP